MRRTSLFGMLPVLALALGPALPASAVSTGAGIFVGACPLASFNLTGTSGPINRLPGPMTMTLTITGSSCVVDTTTGVIASLNAPISSSSFGCVDGLASGNGTFTFNQRTQNVGVTLLNAGGTWTVFLDGLPTFSGAATGVSVPVSCSLGTPAPQLTAVGSLAFEDPELSG